MTLVPALRNAWARMSDFLPWTLPLKLVLSAILGVLGGAGLLGVLSEYATYSYAIYFGFRPPLEGIPYLKATVALGSFTLLISGALVFLLSISIIKYLVLTFEWTFTVGFGVLRRLPRSKLLPRHLDVAHVTARLRVRPTWQVLVLALAVAAATGPIAYFEADYLNRIASEPLPPLHFAAGMMAATFLVTIALANEKAIWWVASTATLAYFIGWLVILFSPQQYSGFLRIVGYGGGIPVVVELREAESSSAPTASRYFLMLRTTEALLLLTERKDQFVEIPRDQLKRVKHDVGGLRALAFELP